MSTLTPNYGYILPGVNDPTDQDLWGGETNSNWTKLDTQLKTITDGLYTVGDFKISYQPADHGQWLLLNTTVRNVSRTTYATLFALIGTTFGSGDGSTTFGLPPAGDKFMLAAGSTHTIGQTGGAESVMLSAANIPSVSVTGTLTEKYSNFGVQNGPAQAANILPGGVNSFNFSGSTVGGSTPTPIMPPYVVGGNAFIYAGS